MQKRSSAPARALATIALVAAFLVVIVVVTNSLSGDGSPGSGRHAPAGKVKKGGGRKVSTRSSYVVQSGDTLTAIAHKTGVSVVQIQKLNPSVDPRVLISGERLKLR
jgi:LysM repeat protein